MNLNILVGALLLVLASTSCIRGTSKEEFNRDSIFGGSNEISVSEAAVLIKECLNSSKSKDIEIKFEDGSSTKVPKMQKCENGYTVNVVQSLGEVRSTVSIKLTKKDSDIFFSEECTSKNGNTFSHVYCESIKNYTL